MHNCLLMQFGDANRNCERVNLLRSWFALRSARRRIFGRRFVLGQPSGSLSPSILRCFLVLDLAEMAFYERQDSNGFGWADECDRHFDEDVQGTQGGRKSSKMAKVKEAATHSVEKTKGAATVSAHKMKSGTSSSLRWIKEKVHRKN